MSELNPIWAGAPVSISVAAATGGWLLWRVVSIGRRRLASSVSLIRGLRDCGPAVDSSDRTTRVVISNGSDLAVAVRDAYTRPVVVAKVQGLAVAPFLQRSDALLVNVYENAALAQLMFESVPLLQSVSNDLIGELFRTITPRT